MKRKLLCGCLAIVLFSLPFSVQAAGSAAQDALKIALGAALFMDSNLSINRNQSCMSCHHPSAAFADPDNVRDGSPVSDGSDRTLFGGRNAPTASYAGFSPKLHWDGELYIGGLFWDGRASGLVTSDTAGLGAGPTRDPLADQAKGPFLNPVEMAMPSELYVVNAVRSSRYARLFEMTFPGVLNDPAQVGVAYNNIAEAIAAFERSLMVNRFNSKFDRFVREQGGDVSTFGIEEIKDPNTGNVVFRKYVGPPPGFKSRYFSKKEAEGLALFNADSEVQLGVGTGANVGGMCYLCHLTERHNPAVYGTNATQLPNPRSADGTYPPIFTDFSYDNLGVPKSANPLIANNPIDLGLGAESRLAELQSLTPDIPKADIAANEMGKFKVSTLRNIARTAPYAHNGFFPTLESIVHFYNTRDNPWPGESFEAAEVPDTVNGDELGNLGLSAQQEQRIVLFLKTLSDK